jgi:hypothetical protein
MRCAAHHEAMKPDAITKPEAKRPTPFNDVGLDEALAGTFPASDPVSPPLHVEEEMERRRKVLDDDAANKRKEAAEEALDEALDETFPASDPIAVHGEAPNPDDKGEHKERRSVRRKRPAGKKKKSLARKAGSRKKAGRKKTARRSIKNQKKRRSR